MYPVIFGSYELMDGYGSVRTIPTTIIIDRAGRIVGRIVDSRTQEQYQEMLKPLLAK